ncbi:hypothetical protein LQ938_00475 [Microbacterium sp. cx-55]|uniref:hypothetical protein n=1 Tax=Microbacterium sp. cx-55 TaxID=2875948 RepID=UPI001CBCAED8|nr:hypothetical protein [Microbacterium sp. cx-55]MBZ4487279.1 hypothetical protein [Microbacterium sp. cx-55]UGB35302.1 hypothetical protein LQ938_00475 [Microbacterium sp. cx-55]
MAAASDLSEYLRGLPEERRATFGRLAAAVADIPVPASIKSFVFRAGQKDHPVYDDAELVFWRAVQQLQLREAVSDGELPLTYWGFHSIDLLARRRVNGILITDRTVYVDDVGRESAQIPTATVDPATIRVADGRLEIAGVGIDLAQVARLLEPTSATDAVGYLSAVITAVRTGASEQPDASPASQPTVDELVRASRLSGDFLLPSRPKDAKGLAKLTAKWKVPADETLLVSLSSATFAGVYGIAITDAAVYSRDLMEPVERTPLGEADSFAWDAETKTFRIADGHLAPTLPAITDDNRAYVADLMRKLFRAARTA